MVIYICDHCKKSDLDYNQVKILYKKWSDDKEPRDFGQLCLDCFAKLEQWMGMKREKWMAYYNEKIKDGMSLEEIDKAYE